MPIKHQMASYRTRKGIRYSACGDYFDLNEAKAAIKEHKQKGFKAFGEKHKDGYVRVFVAKVTGFDLPGYPPSVKRDYPVTEAVTVKE